MRNISEANPAHQITLHLTREEITWTLCSLGLMLDQCDKQAEQGIDIEGNRLMYKKTMEIMQELLQAKKRIGL